tara:strand:- start:313 stop:981 length:669 start_codon:yes stop_codon:yes gene_type:complete
MNKINNKNKIFKKIRKSKKATLGDPLVDFYSYLAFIIIIIIFFLLFNFRGERRIDKISSEVQNLNTNHLTLGYLRTSIVFEEKEMTIADFIVNLEKEIIEIEKTKGKKYVCTDLDDTKSEMIKDNKKCDFLKEITHKISKKNNIPTSVRIAHLSEEEIKEIYKKKYDPHYISFVGLDNFNSKFDIMINKFFVMGKCYEQRIPLYNEFDKNQIIIWMCQHVWA